MPVLFVLLLPLCAVPVLSVLLLLPTAGLLPASLLPVRLYAVLRLSLQLPAWLLQLHAVLRLTVWLLPRLLLSGLLPCASESVLRPPLFFLLLPLPADDGHPVLLLLLSVRLLFRYGLQDRSLLPVTSPVRVHGGLLLFHQRLCLLPVPLLSAQP